MFTRTISTLAALGAFGAVAAQDPISGCSNIQYSGGYGPWLSANCPGPNGTISSAVYLPKKLANINGQLTWKENGNYQCSDCKLQDVATLSCSCADSTGRPADTTLDLSEHIASYDGHLLSDQSGTPSVPPADPNVNPAPTNFRWDLNLGVESCYTEEANPADIGCNAEPVSDAGNCGADPTILNDGQPIVCDQVHEPVTGAYWISFQAVDVATEAPWEFTFYSTKDCTGEPLSKALTLDDGLNQCVGFDDYAVSWSVLPTWYADY